MNSIYNKGFCAVPTVEMDISHHNKSRFKLPSSFVRHLVRWDSSLWAGTWKGGLCKLEKTTGEWKPIAPVLGNHIRALAPFSDRLFVVTERGVFALDKKGDYRRVITDKIHASVLHVSEDYLWVGTEQDSILYLDRRNNWHSMRTLSFDISSLAVSGETVFVASRRFGVLRRAQSGIWELLNRGLPHTLTRLVTVLDDDVFISLWGFGFFRLRSDDSWEHVTDRSVTSVKATNEGVYFGTHGDGLWFAETGKDLWTRLDARNFERTITSIVAIGSWIWFGTEGEGVFKIERCIVNNTTY